jgi:tRNA threonylcarbamoyladenosine biosynthesis protein TsaE
MVIELHGDLGAGKTTWVRHLLQALGVQGRIKSPTYGVVEPHRGQCNGQPLDIWHFDFYRLEDPREWVEAGLRDLFAQPGLKLVEWPEKAGPQRPAADLALHIECVDEQQRQVKMVGLSVKGQRMLEGL